MPVSALREARDLSPQAVAGFALEADRHRRACLKAGDLNGAWEAMKERDSLCALLDAKPGAY